MKKLDRYLFSQFARYFFLIFFCLTGVLFLRNSFTLVEAFVRFHISSWAIVKVLMIALPATSVYAMILAPFFAAAFLAHRLSMDNEILILRACGLRPLRIFLGLVWAGILIAVFAAVNQFFFLPHSLKVLDHLKYGSLKTSPSELLQGQVNWKLGDRYIFIKHADAASKTFQKILIQQKLASGEQCVLANRGHWSLAPNGEGIFLELLEGSFYQFHPIKKKLIKKVPLPLKPLDRERSLSGKGGISMPGLNDRLTFFSFERYKTLLPMAARKIKSDLPKYASWGKLRQKMRGLSKPARFPWQFEWHRRLAFALNPLLLTLLGLSVGMTERRKKRKVSLGLGAGLLILYFLLETALAPMAQTGKLPPPLVVWLPTLGLVFFIFILLRKAFR